MIAVFKSPHCYCELTVPDSIWGRPILTCPVRLDNIATWEVVNQLDADKGSVDDQEKLLLVSIWECEGNQSEVAPLPAILFQVTISFTRTTWC